MTRSEVKGERSKVITSSPLIRAGLPLWKRHIFVVNALTVDVAAHR
jgi:hypothetical protein